MTLPTVAAEALAEHLSTYAEPGPDGLVFPAERGGPIRRSNLTRRVWIPATRAAGVEGCAFMTCATPQRPWRLPPAPAPGS
ncbi:MAG TPA: hypothetical protein VHS79_22190 [Actinomycetes bacterium]|nr:hypothetical protein [Actinomycetes bacterium]